MTNFIRWYDEFEDRWEAPLAQLPPELRDRARQLEVAEPAGCGKSSSDGTTAEARRQTPRTASPLRAIVWDDLTVGERKHLVREIDDARDQVCRDRASASSSDQHGQDPAPGTESPVHADAPDFRSETRAPPQLDPRRQRRDRFPYAFGKHITVAELLRRWTGVDRCYLESLTIDGHLTPSMDGWPVDIDCTDPSGAFHFMIDLEGPGKASHRWLDSMRQSIVVGDRVPFPELPDHAYYHLVDVLDWERTNPALKVPPPQISHTPASPPAKRGRPKSIDRDLIDELIADYAKELREEGKPFQRKDVISEVCQRYAVRRPDAPPLKPTSIVSQQVSAFPKRSKFA